jgi:hypothetical protein
VRSQMRLFARANVTFFETSWIAFPAIHVLGYSISWDNQWGMSKELNWGIPCRSN